MASNELVLSAPIAMSDAELELALDHIEQMADAAGPVILTHFRSALTVDNKAGENDFDPVTIADKAAETAIRDVIHRLRPLDGILGEQQDYKVGQSGLTWIIDPIDGTRAFIAGLPVWGTLIALYNGDHAVLGLMDQPYLKERYLGSRLGASYCVAGQPAKKLRVKPRPALDSAILACTTPDMFTPSEWTQFNKLAKQVATVRYGTDCYGYAMLAAGHVDLVVESALQPYDIQALIPIIEAAGGVVCDWQGQGVNKGGQVVAAASPELAAAALELLQR